MMNLIAVILATSLGSGTIPAPAWLTEIDPVPAPKVEPAGPIDTLREMSALVKKGNALADRSKDLFDAAQGDGLDMTLRVARPRLLRVPVDVVVMPRVNPRCVGGVCEMPAAKPSGVKWMPTRRRVLWRWPRLRWRR